MLRVLSLNFDCQRMFAIVDIETCGGKFEFRKGRITEICILRHDGLRVVEKFSTLVNPECHISSYFSGLTGITNEMVADAPRFHEIAGRIIDMTEGCVFVAHNASFDYGFIRDEFRSLGYTYRRETLCTVRLSRKLMPGKISYSLGHLCAALGIEIFGRHRAAGDAEATAELFDLLLRLKSEDPRYRNMGATELMTRRIDKIKHYILNKLPEACGVYYFLNRTGGIIYIGKSNNAYQRAISHFNTGTKKSREMLHELHDVDFVATGSELIALLLESEEIKKHQPVYNRRHKPEHLTHCIDSFTDARGILNLRLLTAEESEQPLLSFSNYRSARERLDSLIDEYDLCLRYCGLTGEDSQCFHHQIRKCRGLCSGLEESTAYNSRMQTLLNLYRFRQNDFMIIDKGRHPDEFSVVMIENARYKGFGYYERCTQISSPEAMKTCVSPATYHPDADQIIRQFLKQGRRKVIPIGQSREGDPEYI